MVKAGTPSKQIEPDKISWTTRKISPCSCVLSSFTLETQDHYILIIAILIIVGIVVIVVGIVVIVGWIMVIIAQMAGGLHYPELPPHAAPLVSGGYLNCLGKRGPIKATIKGPLIKAPVVSLYLEWCCANSEQSGTRHRVHESGPFWTTDIRFKKNKATATQTYERSKVRKNGIFSESLKLPTFSGGQGVSGLMPQNRIQTKVDAYMKCLELENFLIFLVCRKKLKTIGSVMYSSPQRLAGMSQPTIHLHIAH